MLISTYELGHQPTALAEAAGALRRAGHEVVVTDVAVDAMPDGVAGDVDAVAISVPMHTATRLAQAVVASLSRDHPGLPIALFGLYAGEGSMDGVTARFVGEYEPDLVAWAADGGPPLGLRLSLATGATGRPDRSGLPGIDRYARLEMDGVARPAGHVEASRGCRHRCRHCPIPAVYDGRFRVVDADDVLADVDAQVLAGAMHITWGDPDFLNGPRHSIPLLAEVHRRHPSLTHDVTIKVEHLLAHAAVLEDLAASGVLFVVSAFESVDDRTLRLLDKGHTKDDMALALESVRAAGMDIHPSWMPFVPWTTPDDVVDVFEFIADHDLIGSTDPVQLSIRLLVPRDSLMLGLDDVAAAVDAYDEDALTWTWASADPATDELQRRLASIAEVGVGGSDVETIIAMWRAALEAAGRDPSEASLPEDVTTGRPRLSESWFCCAEPTAVQAGLVGGAQAGR